MVQRNILPANMQFRLSNSQRCLAVGLLGLPLTVTIRANRVSAMVSVRVALTKYRCEFDNLNCIYATLPIFNVIFFQT